jgi:hypothetical protein
MFNLSFLVRSFLDSIRHTNRVINHFNLIDLNGLLVILKIYIIKAFYSFSSIRNRRFPRLLVNNDKNNFIYFNNSDFSTNKIIKDIDDRGFSNIFILREEYKKYFLNEILKCDNYDLKKINLPIDEAKIKKNESLTKYFSRLTNNKISRLTGFLDLKSDSKIKKFLLSDEVLKIVSNYLNCNKISVSAAFFISNPLDITREEQFSNAQYFHWDNDFKKFLKLYIYLTDVDEESGPHVFIKKTHKLKHPNHRLCRLYSDDSIKNYYEKDDVVNFFGESGSIFFVDSYGLHKGETPKKKSRILLNVHYGVDKIFYTNGDTFVNLN